jgi:hypothetical protein
MAQTSPKGRSVEAERFLLRDTSGRARAELSVNSLGAGLRVMDDKGNLRVDLSEGATGPHLYLRDTGGGQEATLWTGYLALSKTPGKPQLVLGGGDFPLGLHLYDTDGKERAGLALSTENMTAGLGLRDADGTGQVSIIAMPNSPTVSLFVKGTHGKLNLTLGLKPDVPGLWLYDENRNPIKGVLWSAP